jgi:raffinose/stachyose/melibiose transport system permease protein
MRNISVKGYYRIQKIGLLFLLITPAFIMFTLFVVIPVFQAGLYSLYRWKGAGPLNKENFQGINNFIKLFKENYFRIAFWNSIKIVVLSLFLQLPVAFMFALLVGRKKFTGSVVFRSFYFFPYVLTEIIVGIIWKFIYDPKLGLPSLFSRIFGDGDTIAFLASPDQAFGAIFLVIFWKYLGYHMVLYIAGLQNVPKELENAAVIDGANKFQVIWHVVIPSIRGTIMMSVFLSIIGSFNVFDVVWAMGQGGPLHSTETLVTYLYNFGFKRFAFGKGSAVAVLIFLMCFVFNILYQKFVVKDGDK